MRKSSRLRCPATARRHFPNDPHRNRMAPGCLGQVALKLSNKGFGSLEK